MSKNRSGDSVIQSAIDIKAWQQNPPTVEQARPASCAQCGAASCPVGCPLQLHGHGTRERQVRGPSAPDKPPVLVLIMARRYRCVVCGAVPIVVPREVVGRRQYSASAIGLALALWGLLLLSTREVRRRCSPATLVGDAAATGWITVRRWTRAIGRGGLFRGIPLFNNPGATLRQRAASAAAALVASAAPTTRALPPEHRAFFGAARAA
jgi:hypothetical protein